MYLDGGLPRNCSPIEKLMMKITAKADRNSSAGTAADSELKMRIYSSASIAANPMLNQHLR